MREIVTGHVVAPTAGALSFRVSAPIRAGGGSEAVLRWRTPLTVVVTGILIALGFYPADAQVLSGHVSQSERQTLIEFFAATGGERWIKRDGWDTSAPV